MVFIRCLILSWAAVASLNAQGVGMAGLGGSFYGSMQPSGSPFMGQPSPFMSRQSPLGGDSPLMPLMSQDNMMVSPGGSPLQMSAYPGMGMRGMPPRMGMGPQMSPAMMSQINPYELMMARRQMNNMGGNGLSGEGMSAGYPFGGPRQAPVSAIEIMGGGQYPGAEREMYGESGLGSPQLTMGGLGARGEGGLAGVSYYPFARIRPGPGLVIVGHQKDQEQGNDQMPMFPNAQMFPQAFDSNATDAETDAIFDALNQTDWSSNLGASTPKANVTTTKAVTKTSTTTVTPAVVKAANITVIFGPNTTPPPCAHPVYMNRVFMSTALSMGLISANTSCVVLLDH